MGTAKGSCTSQFGSKLFETFSIRQCRAYLYQVASSRVSNGTDPIRLLKGLGGVTPGRADHICATHACPLHPGALAPVSCGNVIVRVRVRQRMASGGPLFLLRFLHHFRRCLRVVLLKLPCLAKSPRLGHPAYPPSPYLSFSCSPPSLVEPPRRRAPPGPPSPGEAKGHHKAALTGSPSLTRVESSC